MTGHGDELKPDLLNALDPLKTPEPVEDAVDMPSPLGTIDGSVLDDDSPSPSESTSSIFDEADTGPIDSVEEIPDAVPNISDGGTEILSRGRAEIQEFNEEFSSNLVPTEGDVASEGLDIHPTTVGGLLLNDLEDVEASSTVIIQPPTVIMRRQEHEQKGHELGAEVVEEEFPVTEDSTFEASEVSDSILDLSESGTQLGSVGSPSVDSDADGMSLSDMTSAVIGGAAVTSATSRTTASAAPGRNRALLIALGGYAVVVTLLCILLLSLLAKARSASRLESLPDVPPEPVGKMTLIPVNAELPPGHRLSLGESQQYGSLRIEPLKVTRGPIRFVYSGGKHEESFQTEAVLKLWVKLTNHSSEQVFAPLDGNLMFRRSRDGLRSNTFVIQKSDQPQGTPLVLAHHDDLLSNPDWKLSEQRLGQTLQPGESVETFIPTSEEGIDDLSGELIWRLHVRKGNSPSGLGVTTLVEVAFRDDQIQPEGT